MGQSNSRKQSQPQQQPLQQQQQMQYPIQQQMSNSYRNFSQNNKPIYQSTPNLGIFNDD